MRIIQIIAISIFLIASTAMAESPYTEEEIKAFNGIKSKLIKTHPGYSEAQIQSLAEEIFYQKINTEVENKELLDNNQVELDSNLN